MVTGLIICTKIFNNSIKLLINQNDVIYSTVIQHHHFVSDMDLVDAAQEGKTDECERLLLSGVDPNFTDEVCKKRKIWLIPNPGFQHWRDVLFRYGHSGYGIVRR